MNKKLSVVKLQLVLPLCFVMAITACHSYSKSQSSYSAAVSSLASKRADSLKNAGCSIIAVNSKVGYVKATGNFPLHIPRADASRLKNAPVYLETNEWISASEPKIFSSVTGYLIANNSLHTTQKSLQQEISQKAKQEQR